MNVGALFVAFGVKTDQSSFQLATSSLKALKAAAAVTGVVSLGQDLIHMAVHAAESATHILGMSSALGMTTKSVQEWSYVAQQAGSDINQFSVGISMFERNLKEFAAGRGSQRFKDAMHAVGITSAEARQDLAGPDGVNAAVFKVSDAYLKMGNSANRAAINTGLFGARARGMAQDLGRGSAALRQQIAHLHEIGGVVDEDKLLKAKAFNNSINDLKVSLSALAMEVTAAVGPGFSEMLQGAVKWVSENKELISNVLIDALKALGDAFKVVMVVVNAFTTVLKAAFDGNAFAQAGLITLAGFLVSLVVPALFAAAGAAWAFISPLLLPTLIIGSIILAVLLLREHWDEITEAMSEAWDVVWDKISGFGNLFKRVFTAFFGVLSAFGHLVVDTFVHIGKSIGSVFEGLGKLIWDALGAVWDPVRAAAGRVLDWIEARIKNIKDAFSAIRDFFVGEDAKEASGGKPAQKETGPLGGLFDAFDPTAVVKEGVTANAPAGSVAAVANSAANRQPSTVTIGPTTVNINGVQGAVQAQQSISDAIDAMHRHGAAALGGEVQ